ncbi:MULTISPECIES: bestrophin-like domain [unclassified Mycolicibacterium]|uniref:bestrophin-like domain n=1 Tax=unclassified Mycolicibacterium TaxID=2636767 RepID=UPI002ED7A8E3
MSRWLLNNVPSWLLLLGLVVLVAGGAMLLLSYVRHRFPRLEEGEHNHVTLFAFSFIGFMFAILVTFFTNTFWGQINDADSDVRTESATGVQLAGDISVFDKADSDRIRGSLLEYQRAAIAEWPEASGGNFSPEADKALGRVYTAYRQVQPHNDIQTKSLDTSMANLDSIRLSRTERILQARVDVGPPWSLWVVILLTSGLVLGCSIIYGVEKPGMHYGMVASLGVLIAAALFMVLEFSHPYIGELATSPQPLYQVIQVLSDAPA